MNLPDIQIKFSKKITQLCPELSSKDVDVLSRAMLYKICEGVTYPQELEEKIQKIFPLIKSINIDEK
jgi:hypothetical protein